MKDRTDVLILTIAGALAALGIILVVIRLSRKAGIRPRMLRADDLRRWFMVGFERMLAVWPLFAVLAIVALMDSIVVELQVLPLRLGRPADATGWIEHAPSWSHRALALLRGSLDGWNIIVPVAVFGSAWTVGIWVLLILARRRGRFPFSAGKAAINLWLSLALLKSLIWLYGNAKAALAGPMARFPNINGVPNPWDMALEFVLGILLGWAFVLPPFLAVVDDETEAFLRRPGGRWKAVFGSLAILTLFGHIPGYATWFLESIGWPNGFRHFELAWINWQSPAAFLLGLFFLTAVFPTCSTASLRGTFRRTLGWWKRDALFLLLLPLCCGLIRSLISLAFQTISGEGTERSRGIIAASSIVGGLVHVCVGISLSLAAFCLLLGNWSEAQDVTLG